MKQAFLECISFCKKTILAEVIVELLQIAVSLYTASVAGDFAEALFAQNTDHAISNLWYIILCIGANFLLVPAISYCGDVVCIKGSIRYGVHMFSRFVNMRYETAVSIPVGEVKARLESDVIMFRNAVILVLARLIIVPIGLSALLFQMGRISTIYMIIACLLALIVLITPVLTRNKTATYEDEVRRYEADSSTLLHELLTLAPYAKLFHVWKKLVSDFDALFGAHFRKTRTKAIALSEVARSLIAFTVVLANCGVLIIGALLKAADQISAGSIIAMAGYYATLLSLFENVGYIFTMTKQLKNLGERVSAFYLSENRVAHKPLQSVFPIRVNNVSYYKSGERILTNVSFDIYPGEKVALIGKNGTGKSTLLKILTGLYRTYEGEITYGGISLNNCSTGSLAQCYSYVPQKPFVYSGTVWENVRFGNFDVADAQVEEIMRELNLMHLRDYVIDEKGSNLSGGELQRISLARAALKKYPLMIMDEPSNHLDHDCLAWLNNYISTCQQAILYVSHDIPMIEIADTIIDLSASTWSVNG